MNKRSESKMYRCGNEFKKKFPENLHVSTLLHVYSPTHNLNVKVLNVKYHIIIISNLFVGQEIDSSQLI